jgi:anti-sigma regulatory factor (Ser/Thr protein kinase)
MVAQESWMTFEASVEAPSHARRWITPLLPADSLEAGLLALSEIVTNALIHSRLGGAESVTVRVAPAADGVRVSVRHRALFPAVPRRREPGEVGGWGLRLVEKLSTAWGVERADENTVLVWFEI